MLQDAILSTIQGLRWLWEFALAPHGMPLGWTALGGLVAIFGLATTGGVRLFAGEPARHQGHPPLTVVVLYPDASNARPGVVAADHSLRSAILRGPARIDVINEHLDMAHVLNPEYRREFARLIEWKYKRRRIDLVIAAVGICLDYVLEFHETTFQRAPIVYCALEQRELRERDLRGRAVGTPIEVSPLKSLELALRIHPEVRKVTVICGVGPLDVYWSRRVREEFDSSSDGVQFEYLDGLPTEELLHRAAALSTGDLVYYVHVMQDETGQVLRPADVLEQIAEVTSVPVYGHLDSLVGLGLTGGYCCDLSDAGRQAGTLGLRVLQGEPLDKLADQPVVRSYPCFDSRELLQFGIPNRKLPHGSTIFYQEESIWRRYAWHIGGVLLLCLLEAGLIAALLRQRRALRFGKRELERLAVESLRAEETERRRIARELHDDLGQGLALLALKVDRLERQAGASGATAAGSELSQLVAQLSSAVHSLSHRLHPSKLEHLGLVGSIGEACSELRRNHGLEVAFANDLAGVTLDDAIALCAYRIVQESLHNIVKHSGARRVWVELRLDAPHLLVSVADDGRGFDVERSEFRHGLGLVSIRERLRLLGGSLQLDSDSTTGTRLEAIIPLPAEPSQEIHG